jgi:hypothetical protein
MNAVRLNIINMIYQIDNLVVMPKEFQKKLTFARENLDQLIV